LAGFDKTLEKILAVTTVKTKTERERERYIDRNVGYTCVTMTTGGGGGGGVGVSSRESRHNKRTSEDVGRYWAAAVEYRVLRHIVYPLSDRLAAGSGAFLARLRPTTCCSDNEVDVLLTLFGKTCATTQKNVKSHVFFWILKKKRKKTYT